MAHEDALSRIPFIAVIEQGDVDFNIQITQSRDKTIRKIRNRLEEGDLEEYTLENGLVFRHRAQGQRQLCVFGVGRYHYALNSREISTCKVGYSYESDTETLMVSKYEGQGR